MFEWYTCDKNVHSVFEEFDCLFDYNHRLLNFKILKYLSNIPGLNNKPTHGRDITNKSENVSRMF